MYLQRTTHFITKLEKFSFLNISLANSIPTMHTLKTINPSPNMSVEVLHTKNHFTRVLQIPLTCHVIIKLIFLALWSSNLGSIHSYDSYNFLLKNQHHCHHSVTFSPDSYDFFAKFFFHLNSNTSYSIIISSPQFTSPTSDTNKSSFLPSPSSFL